MKKLWSAFYAIGALALCLSTASVMPPAFAAQSVARSWIDALTGHKIVRVTSTPNSTSLYFHQNSFTPQGDKLAISTPEGIAVVTVDNWSVKMLVPGKNWTLLFTGRKSRNVYFANRKRDDAGGAYQVFAANVDTGKTHKVADVAGGTIGSINADETLLLGQVTLAPGRVNPDGTLKPQTESANDKPGYNEYAENRMDGSPYSYAEAKERSMQRRLHAGLPMEIYTINIETGERRVVTASTDWLNHIQFSPIDPYQIMYCHEGPWHEVDRIWTIRADGSGKTKIHERTMNMEIAGHEFFSPDGEWIWYDLQTPRGEVFWLAGYHLASKKRVWYKVDRNHWSVHYNMSPDGSDFSGDGGDAEMVAKAPDGKYLYLFTPKTLPNVADITAPNADQLIQTGTLDAHKLVDLRGQNYKLEPNMIFTPDGKWIVFRGNFEGETHVYAVEVAKSTGP